MKETGQFRNVPHFMKADISLGGHNSPTLDTASGLLNIIHIIIPHFFMNKCGFTAIHAQDR
jgi:hypothetical protein